MEIRIVIFLAFVSVTLITNTLLIIFAYKVVAGMTSKLTATMSSFSQSGETRESILSLQTAAEHAAKVTESTKSKIAAFDPVLARLEENYRGTLAAADSKLETVADNINTSAEKIRDVIATPAFAAASFVAGLMRILNREL